MPDLAVEKLLDQFREGIDWIIGKSDAFGAPFGNQLRVELFNARQTVETIREQQGNIAAPPEDVQQGDATSGAVNAGNMAGTGNTMQPAVIAAVPIPLEGSEIDVSGKPAGISQAVWDAMPAATREAVLSNLPAAQEGWPAAPVAEPDVNAPTPPWAPADGAPAA